MVVGLKLKPQNIKFKTKEDIREAKVATATHILTHVAPGLVAEEKRPDPGRFNELAYNGEVGIPQSEEIVSRNKKEVQGESGAAVSAILLREAEKIHSERAARREQDRVEEELRKKAEEQRRLDDKELWRNNKLRWGYNKVICRFMKKFQHVGLKLK